MHKRSIFTGDCPALLDGAAGTHLMERGLPMGVCPEAWAAEHADIIRDMHASYVKAGAQAVYAFTFGANPVTLAEYGIARRTEELNERLVAIAREAVGENIPVGGDLTALGQLMQPIGSMTFERTKAAYKRQAAALYAAGADFLVIETMLDIAQGRAAILGCREACDLPIWISMTFEQGARTLTGTDARTAAITLCALGVSAVGVNCATGPADMAPIVEAMRRVATVPVFAKPNAGLPNGNTLGPCEFADQTAQLIQHGAKAVGGCCGTTPEHIRMLHERITPMRIDPTLSATLVRTLTGRESSVDIRHGSPLVTIGERINPTGKRKLQQALVDDDMEYVLNMANDQIRAGAHLLDVNVGMPDVDQSVMLPKVVEMLAGRTGVPLCLDSVDQKALAAALEIYPGRALINSISYESGRAETLFPLCRDYGAMAILLPMDDSGVPETARSRILLIEALLKKAEEYGLTKDSFVVDALAMALAGQPGGGKEAIEVLRWCKEQNLLTVMGVSNISFGLPHRPALNAAFVCAAQACGLTMAIVNVGHDEMKRALLAANALLCGGDEVALYAQHFAQKPHEREGLAGAVLYGERKSALLLANQALHAGTDPLALIDEVMEGLTILGDMFAQKKTYLPQLMAGAEAAKAALAPVQAALQEDSHPSAGTAVIATAKGDLHDIGKNIVALMLQNHGFRVIDLGKDVENETVLRVAQDNGADIVCLSALLTTTMEQMRTFSAMNKRQERPFLLMVGGAVVTNAFAEQIDAYYAPDAVQSARLALELVKERNKA